MQCRAAYKSPQRCPDPAHTPPPLFFPLGDLHSWELPRGILLPSPPSPHQLAALCRHTQTPTCRLFPARRPSRHPRERNTLGIEDAAGTRHGTSGAQQHLPGRLPLIARIAPRTQQGERGARNGTRVRRIRLVEDGEDETIPPLSPGRRPPATRQTSVKQTPATTSGETTY